MEQVQPHQLPPRTRRKGQHAIAENAAAQEVAQQQALQLSMHGNLDAIRNHTTRAEEAMMCIQASEE